MAVAPFPKNEPIQRYTCSPRAMAAPNAWTRAIATNALAYPALCHPIVTRLSPELTSRASPLMLTKISRGLHCLDQR